MTPGPLCNFIVGFALKPGDGNGSFNLFRQGGVENTGVVSCNHKGRIVSDKLDQGMVIVLRDTTNPPVRSGAHFDNRPKVSDSMNSVTLPGPSILQDGAGHSRHLVDGTWADRPVAEVPD